MAPKPIKKVLLIVAMTHEALPVIEKLSLSLASESEGVGSMVTYTGSGPVSGTQIVLLTNGLSTVYEADGYIFLFHFLTGCY